jgi:Fis family transcriptional regulator, factor for inversion stimulation protein
MTSGARLVSLTHEKERRRQPLNAAVRVALELYFKHLEDQHVTELYRRVMEEVERPLLETTLAHSGGNQTRAARMLGLNRGTLRKKLKQYGLD